VVRVLITGGTGYLGGAVVKAFVEAGWPVRCMVRRTSSTVALSAEVEVVTADVTDPESLRRAISGVEVVCHSAALVASWARDRRLFDAANVEGTANVLEAARQAGVSRVVYTSSFLALGPTDEAGVADESLRQPRRSFLTDYERSKTRALERAREFAERGLPVVIVMPGTIFGPGKSTSGSLLNSLIDQAARGKPARLVGDGRQRWCVAYIRDVARGHVLAAERGRPGESYILGGENPALEDFLAKVCELADRPWRPRKVPAWLAKMMTIPQLVRAWLGGRPPEFTPGAVGTFVHSWAYSSEKACRELNYEITPLETALRETLDWLQDTHAGAE